MNIDYSTQSAISDPGRHAALLDGLPTDPAVLVQVVQGLVYHYVAGRFFFGHQPPAERIGEVDSRSLERILDRLVELDPRPLTQARRYEDRVVGCCRDFSLLACAVLRHHGIPARLRYGFAGYFEPGYFGDHVIVETWTGSRWRRFDPQLAGVAKTQVDLLDLPDGAFVTGGRAWQMCRAGADAARFGLGPQVPEVSGLWFVRGRMQLDLAALRKRELLCWDEWLYGVEAMELTAGDEELLDRAAAADEPELSALLDGEARLALPTEVNCFSPAVGPHQVALQ
jgi:hypothetical protein